MSKYNTLLILFICLTSHVSAGEVPEVTFVEHVRPLMQRLGCAAFLCHGGIDGQGEFRLSRNGLNTNSDYEESLKFCKSSDSSDDTPLLTAIQEHEAEERISLQSDERHLFRIWMKQGFQRGKRESPQHLKTEPAFVECINGEARIEVTAFWKDGSRQSVTDLVVVHLENPSTAQIEHSGRIVGLSPGSTGFSVSYRGVTAYGMIVVPVSDNPATITHLKIRNGIDQHVGRTLQALKISPSPEATSKILLRRVSFDLTGAPPTRQDYDACPDNWSQTEYAAHIDQLINSDLFSRKWGRWIAELSGCDERTLSPAAFAMKVRNEPLASAWYEWTRKRVAQDVPYHEIVRNQIAAISRGNRSTQQYSDFHENLCGTLKEKFSSKLFADEPCNDLFWKTTLGRRNEFIAQQFLGIDLKCARCHDHPSERWTQNDHDAFAAVFNRVVYQEQPLTRHNKRQVLSYVAGGIAFALLMLLAISLKLRKLYPTISNLLLGSGVVILGFVAFCGLNYLHLLDEKMTFTARGFGVYFVDTLCPWADSQLKVVSLGVIAIVACLVFAVLVFRSRKIVARVAGWGSIAVLAFIAAATIDAAYVHTLGEGQDRFSGVHALHHAVLRKAGVGGREQQPREIFLSHSADRSTETIPAVPAGPSLSNGVEDDPRTELVEWVIHKDPNQYLARNFVNRVWAEIMGEGLVTPVDNLSPLNPPSNPFLLDWLVSDFINHNWSLKHLVRQIVLSSAYRRSTIEFDDPRGARSIRPLQAAERFHLFEAIAGTKFQFGKDCNPQAKSAYDAFVRLRPSTPADKLLKQLLKSTVKNQKDIPLNAALNSLHDIRRLNMITKSKPWLETSSKLDVPTKIDHLCLLVMGKELKSQHRELLIEYVENNDNQQSAWNEILWILLNTEEAQFNY